MLILEEIKRVIPGDEIQALLQNKGELDILASWKRRENPICLTSQEEITVKIFEKGKAEIITTFTAWRMKKKDPSCILP